MAKKKSTRTNNYISHNKTHILLRKSMIVYVSLVFIGFVLVSLSALAIVSANRTYAIYKRETQIADILNSLELDSSYIVAHADVFGDKRPYSWDSDRTMASSVSYGRNADRDATFADLNTRITSAGFTQIESPSYGSAARQDHYVSDAGEYIRVSIDTSEQYNSLIYGTDYPSAKSIAEGEGPVYVTIRVNLDDNNE